MQLSQKETKKNLRQDFLLLKKKIGSFKTKKKLCVAGLLVTQHMI